MARYLVQVSYTPEAWNVMVNNPQDRAQVVKSTVEKLGGRIEQSWLSFGDYDIMVVLDMPDGVSAAAFSMAVSAGGSCKAVKTTQLLTAEEGIEAMRKAATSGYRPVVKTQTAR